MCMENGIPNIHIDSDSTWINQSKKECITYYIIISILNEIFINLHESFFLIINFAFVCVKYLATKPKLHTLIYDFYVQEYIFYE